MGKRIFLGIALVAFMVCALALAQGLKATDDTKLGVVEVKRAQPGVGKGKGGKVIPWHINYQGYLTDDAGNEISGNLNMIFSIWTASSGGSELWGEGQVVGVEEGLFNVVLGSTPIPPSVFEPGESRWLQLGVEGQTLLPRTEITSVGYAYRAVTADTSVYALNSEKVDDFDASATPSANDLFPLSYGDARYINAGEPVGNADMVDSIHASRSPEPNKLLALRNDGTFGVFINVASEEAISGRNDGAEGEGVEGWATNAAGGHSHGVGGGYLWMSLPTGGFGVVGGGERAGVYGAVNMPGGYGVWGRSQGGDYGVYYEGGLGGTGTKSCIVKTSKGPVALYCQESPENWFEDFGNGRLTRGRAHIELDPLFLETVTINTQYPMKVFVQLTGDCRGIYVVKGQTGFDVAELEGGTSNVSFDYRVVAKRRDFEDYRLRPVPSAYSDSYLYPENRKKEEVITVEDRFRQSR